MNDEDGDRGPYHISDSLYFGNSLVWHRGSITLDAIKENQPGGVLRVYIDRALRYHRRREGGPGPFLYHVKIWADRGADVTLSPKERWTRIPVTEFQHEVL